MDITVNTTLIRKDTSSAATQGTVTFSVTGTYTTGNYIDGPAYIVVPSGSVDMAEPTPIQTLEGGLKINGAQKNPQVTGGNTNLGYDEREAVGWDAAANLTAWPLAVTAGDVIVKSVGSTTYLAARDGILEEIAACFVVSSEPPANSFSPSALGWTGRTFTSYVVDIAAKVATLPSYVTTTHDKPTYAQLMARLDHYWPLMAQTGITVNYQYYVPTNVQETNNWGGYLVGMYQASMLALISDDFTTAQKEAIATRLVSQGIQIYDSYTGGAVTLAQNGGHFQFHFGMVALALEWTGRSADLATLMTDLDGNFGQAFQVSAAQALTFTNHIDTAKPYMWRSRDITNVTGLTIETEWTRSGTTGDNSKVGVHANEMKMTRVSDGATALVGAVAFDVAANATSNHDVVIDVQPGSPFIIGDVVYFEPVVVPIEGDYDWTINGTTYMYAYSPAAGQTYRSSNYWSGTVLFLKAAEIWHSTFDVIEGYVVRANTADEPSVVMDFPDHHSVFTYEAGTLFSWDADFWNAHWATIGGYTEAYVDNVGTEYISVSSGAGPANSATLNLAIRFKLQTVSGNLYMYGTDGRSYVAMWNDEIKFYIKDSANAVVMDFTTAAENLVVGTEYFLEVVIDLSAAGNGTIEAALDGNTLTLGTVAANSGLVGLTSRTSGFLASGLGTSIMDTQVSELFWSTGTLTLGDLWNGGTKANLATLAGHTPEVYLGAGQVAADWNTPTNLGSATITSTGGFVDV